ANRWPRCSLQPQAVWPTPDRCRGCRPSPGQTFRAGRNPSLERTSETSLVAEEILAVEIGRFQPQHVLDRMHDGARVGIELVLELAHRRTGRVGKADAPDRRLEPAEALLVDARRQLGAEPAVDPIAISYDAASGPIDRFDDQILVERRQGARVDN